VPYVRQRLEVALFGFVSTRCIASEVLIKASFMKKILVIVKEYYEEVNQLMLLNHHFDSIKLLCT
jgi:hypothetical protein